jgi:hypothetical protein
LGDAWTLASLSEIDLRAAWPRIALGMDASVPQLPAVVLDGSDIIRWYHGRSLTVPYSGQDDGSSLMRVYDPDGRFAGIGQIDESGGMSPRLVLSRTTEIGDA